MLCLVEGAESHRERTWKGLGGKEPHKREEVEHKEKAGWAVALPLPLVLLLLLLF